MSYVLDCIPDFSGLDLLVPCLLDKHFFFLIASLYTLTLSSGLLERLNLGFLTCMHINDCELLICDNRLCGRVITDTSYHQVALMIVTLCIIC